MFKGTSPGQTFLVSNQLIKDFDWPEYYINVIDATQAPKIIMDFTDSHQCLPDKQMVWLAEKN